MSGNKELSKNLGEENQKKSLDLSSFYEDGKVYTESEDRKNEFISSLNKQYTSIRSKSFEEKRKIFDIKSLNQEGKTELIKIVISSLKKDGTKAEKVKTRKMLEGMFTVGELVDPFQPTYSRKDMTDQTKGVFLNKALASKNKNSQKYSNQNGYHNELIRTYFLDTMFDIVDVESNLKPNTLDEERKHYLDCFFLENKLNESQKSAIISGINALGQTNKNQTINSLDKQSFSTFLNLIVELGDKNSKSISDLNTSEKGADSIGYVESIITEFSNLKKLAKEKGVSINVSTADIRNHIQKSSPNLQIQTKIYNGNTIFYTVNSSGEDLELYSSSDTYQQTAIQSAIISSRLRETGDEDVIRQLNDIESNFYNAYAGLGKSDILEKSRGSDYFQEVQTRTIASQGIKLESYSSYSSAKSIETKLGTKLENIEELNTIVDDTKLQGNLSDEEFKEVLNGTNPKRDSPEQNELEKDSSEIANKKSELKFTANEEVKKGYMDRVNYFFTNILDVQIDKNGQENILKNIQIDPKSDLNTEVPYKIAINGKFNGTDLKFVYDIESGELSTNQILSNDKKTENVDFNNKMQLFQNLKGPKLGEYQAVAKNINYGNLLSKSKGNNEAFGKEIKTELLSRYPRVEQSDTFKLEMQKQVLMNVVTNETLDIIGVSGKAFLNKPINGGDKQYKLFPLLARTFSSYNIEELNQFRETTKYMSDFYNKIEKLENPPKNIFNKIGSKIDSKLKGFQSKISPRYSQTKEYITKIFVDKRDNSNKPNYTGKQFFSFFSAFFAGNERLSPDGKNIIDPVKLVMFQNDLQDKSQKETSKTGDYIAKLEGNMENQYADEDLKKDIKNLDQETQLENLA